MADPEMAERMDALISRYGDVQGRFSELGGYELEARAQEILHGLGFDPEMVTATVGTL